MLDIVSPSAVATQPEFYYRPHILIAEDDEDLALAVSIMLAEQFDVSLRPCAREALQSFAVDPPDLILIDYQLPDMNGLRPIESIRRR
jgi:DNA-binding response OmpR family regulator